MSIPPNQYPVGEQITLTAKFYAGTPPVLTDPTAVTGELLLPNQTVVPLTVTKASTGVYQANYLPAYSPAPAPLGLHQWRMAGTGAVIAAVEGAFIVTSEFTS